MSTLSTPPSPLPSSLPLKDEDLSLGLAFVSATASPSPASTSATATSTSTSTSTATATANASLSLHVPQLPTPLEQLEFIDAVFTLISEVVAIPQTAAAMTDCGLVPALLTILESSPVLLSSPALTTGPSNPMQGTLTTYITSQTIQILEAVIVNHSNAMTAFNDLKGSDLLVSRLHFVILRIEAAGSTSPPPSSSRPLNAPLRVLLFSIINILTVLYHSHASNQNSNMTVDGTATPLIKVIEDILNHAVEYGGVLTSLTCSLLSDIVNSDPRSLQHIHSSGLADCFFNVLREGKVTPTPELIMAIPNVVSALSLTDAGSNLVLKANPFPAMIKVFYTPKYAMPNSRALQGDMAAIFGTGLHEIIHHVKKLQEPCLDALNEAVEEVVKLGRELSEMETNSPNSLFHSERTLFLQYVSHISQLIEQVVLNEDNAKYYIKSGGISSLLSLYEHLLPNGRTLLSHISCLSNISIAHLSHFAAASHLTMTIKALAKEQSPVIANIVGFLTERFKNLADISLVMRNTKSSNNNSASSTLDINAEGILADVPRVPLHNIDAADFAPNSGLMNYSQYIRSVAVVEWLSSVLASVIRTASLKSENSNRWRQEAWWNDVTSDNFNVVFKKLSALHRSTQLETCRVRTEDNYATREEERTKNVEEVGTKHHPRIYVLRIVNPDGAVIRDGIEIDFCNNVGSYDMGSIVVANDRCINASGVMRYRGPRGWVSECTRGQGREPICEVVGVHSSLDDLPQNLRIQYESISKTKTRKGTECGISDLATVGAHVLSRLQTNFKTLLTTLSKSIMGGLTGRSSVLSLTYEDFVGKVILNVASAIEKSLGAGMEQVRGRYMESEDLSYLDKNMMEEEGYWKWNGGGGGFGDGITGGTLRRGRSDSVCTGLGGRLSMGGSAMYLGSVLEIIMACIFDEKKSRR